MYKHNRARTIDELTKTMYSTYKTMIDELNQIQRMRYPEKLSLLKEEMKTDRLTAQKLIRLANEKI